MSRQLVGQPRPLRPRMSLPAMALLAAVVLAAGGTTTASGAAGNVHSGAVPDSAVLGLAGLVSCPSAGDCAAAGSFRSGRGFVVDQVGGRWGRGQPVTASFRRGLPAEIRSLSCPSAGSCAAGGSVGDAAFVVSQVRGAWGKPRRVAGNLPGGPDEITSLSCGSPGNCTAGGDVGLTDFTSAAFLVSEHRGRWGAAFPVPGLARLDTGQDSAVTLVSCPSAGNCAAGGADASQAADLFLVIERSGRWGHAFAVAGNVHASFLSSLSCAAAGDCVVAGDSVPEPGHLRPFLVTESNGHRGNAFGVPGLAVLNRGDLATLKSVSCASPGNCAAGGSYTDAAGNTQAFVVTERSGRWGKAMRLPGLAVLNVGGLAEVTSVSCPSLGSCVAVGHFMARDTATSFSERPFADSQRNGRWAQVIRIRGLPSPEESAGGLQAVSCASPSNCAAAGDFLVDKVNGRWRTLFFVRVG